MKPLKVVWQIATPLILPGNGLLHADALMAWAVTERAMAALRRAGDPIPVGASIRSLAEELPLSKFVAPSGAWCWCASALHFEREAHAGRSMTAMVRRTEVDDLLGLQAEGALRSRATKVNLASGPQRNFLLRFDLTYARTATAWMLGDAAAVQDLLGDVKHLGKKGASGFGVVNDFSVTQVPESECHWQRRAMPSPHSTHVPTAAALRPPYWDATSFTQTWVPVDLA